MSPGPEPDGTEVGSAEDDVPAIERLVDLACFGPFTLGARLVGQLPRVVDRTRNDLVVARILGKMAVDQGGRELRRRLRAVTDGTGDDATSTPSAAEDVDALATVAAPAPPVATAPDEGEELVEAPDVSELALPDYDHLPAAHVVGKLAGLSDAERELIERYERAHRHRRTVLGKLDQLRPLTS